MHYGVVPDKEVDIAERTLGPELRRVAFRELTSKLQETAKYMKNVQELRDTYGIRPWEYR
jgi:hypothetical protein